MKIKRICFLGSLLFILFSSCANINKSANDSQNISPDADNITTVPTIHENGITVNYSDVIREYTVKSESDDNVTLDFTERMISCDVLIDETKQHFYIRIYRAESSDKENILTFLELKNISENTVHDTFDSSSDLEAKIINYLVNEGLDGKTTNSISIIIMRIANDMFS